MSTLKSQVLLWLSVSLLSAALASGCASSPGPQAQADAQVARGGPIYARDCATELCHGTQGEGLRSGDNYRVWPLLGAEFEARNPNAQVIFDVVRSGGEANLQALSDEEIYAAIAYELAQNGVQLSAPLTEGNASDIASGASSPPAGWGSLYPPAGNARLLPPPMLPAETLQGTAGALRLRVDQLAKASVIGKSVSPEGGYFVILVFALQNMGAGELSVEPGFLRLVDTLGVEHAPAPATLAYPMERFHRLTIRPGYGAAGYEIFAVPPGADYSQLVYDDASGEPLVIDLR